MKFSTLSDMRIIAGSLKSRAIASPHNNKTHPMSEKMRGAMFNALGDISGLTFFDPFAGTGACSFEALSRGARSAQLLEVNPDSFKTIVQNIQDLGLENSAKAKRANCASWSANNKDVQFDIVLADPPYRAKDIDIALVFKMARHVKPGGILVVSAPPEQHGTVELRASQHKEVTLLSHKVHGDGGLYFYRKNA